MKERFRVAKLDLTLVLLLGVWFVGVAFSLMEVVGVVAGSTLAAVSFAVAVVAMAFGPWRRSITLDDDGVHIRSAFRHRFVPYVDIDRVRRRARTVETKDNWGRKRYHTANHVEVSLRSGEVVELNSDDPARLAERILARKHQAEISSRKRPLLLQRGDRSSHEWIAELRRRGERRADYRSAPTELASLWNIVESRWQRADDRAAAAVALGHQASPEARTRLLRIAGDADSPKLRIAIQQSIEEDDDDTLAEAIDALAADGRAGPRTTTR